MAQTINEVASILKTAYLPVMDNQLGIKPSPFIEKIEKRVLKTPKITLGVKIGLNGGFAFGTETVTPRPGAQRYDNLEVTPKDMYADIQISDKAIKLGGGGEASMFNLLDEEVRGSQDAANFNIGRAAFGNGTGKLCDVTAGTSTNTVTVSDTRNLMEGLIVDFYADGTAVGGSAAVEGVRIMAVDRKNKTVTFSGAAVSVPKGFMTLQYSYGRELTGLGAIFDDTTTHLYGVEKNGNPWLIPEVRDLSGDGVTDVALYAGVNEAKRFRGSDIDMILMGDDAFRAYMEYMKLNNTVIVERMEFVGGATGLILLVGSQKVVIVNEGFVPNTEAWAVDTKTFRFERTPLDFVVGQNGAPFNLINGTSVMRALLASYGDIVCTRPGGCVKFTNCVPN